MKKLRCRIVWMLCLVLLVGLPVATVVAAVPSPTSRFFVNDFAGVLDAAAEDKVYAAGVKLFEATKAQAVLVTVESLDGEAVEDYARTLARNWGIGDAEENSGVLLLLSVGDRAVRIEVGYGLEGRLTDANTGLLLDTYAMEAFTAGDYSTGLLQTYDALVNEIYLEHGLEPTSPYTPVEDVATRQTRGSLFGGIAMLAILLLLPIFSARWGLPIFPFFFGGFFPRGGFGGGGFRGGGGGFGGGGASRRF